MCIRDSANVQFQRELAHRQPVRVRQVDPRRRDAILLPDICLLYTSDAADERSSVDLGGRRIIKKKKHVHLASTRPE